MKVNLEKIRNDLEKVGVQVDCIYDLVNTKKSYPLAIPVLLNLITLEFENIKYKEGVVRALAVKAAIGKAAPVLIEEYNKVSKTMDSYRWAIGNTIGHTFTESDIESLLTIIQDKENGRSRQMIVMGLGKVKAEKVENVLISLLDDEDVSTHAIFALGKMKSQKAKDKISGLANHPRALVRQEVKKALKKIG